MTRLCLALIGVLLLSYAVWGLLTKCLTGRAVKLNLTTDKSMRHELVTMLQLILVIIGGSAGAVLGLRLIDAWIAGW